MKRISVPFSLPREILFVHSIKPKELAMSYYYVYVLQSKKDKNYYVGFTTDLTKRLNNHNKGRVTSTRKRGPFKLVCVAS